MLIVINQFTNTNKICNKIMKWKQNSDARNEIEVWISKLSGLNVSKKGCPKLKAQTKAKQTEKRENKKGWSLGRSGPSGEDQTTLIKSLKVIKRPSSRPSDGILMAPKRESIMDILGDPIHDPSLKFKSIQPSHDTWSTNLLNKIKN